MRGQASWPGIRRNVNLFERSRKETDMNVDEIIAAIDSQDDALPRRALEAAMARPGEVTEPLLKLVEETVRHPAKVLGPDNHSMGHLIALYLLAQFRETRALPLLVEALSLPGADVVDLFGDALLGDMACILASVSGGELEAIQGLIESPDVHPRVRRAALEALYTLVRSRAVERQAVVDYLGELFAGKLERRPSEVWTDLVRTAAWLGPVELFGEIRKAHGEGLLTGDEVRWVMEDAEESRAWSLERGVPQIADTGAHDFIRDTLREIGGYGCFSAETRLRPEEVFGC